MPVRWFHAAADHDAHDEGAALAAVLSAHPELESEPGVKYKYSNIGYWLLGEVVESASGEDLADYFDAHLRAPLDIPADALTFASMWGERDGRWIRVQHICHDGRAYGGLYGTADGLVPIARDLLTDEPTLLNTEHRDAMLEGHLGWSEGELNGARWFAKAGGGPGHFSLIRLYPDEEIATILLVNQTEVREPKITRLADAVDRRVLSGLQGFGHLREIDIHDEIAGELRELEVRRVAAGPVVVQVLRERKIDRVVGDHRARRGGREGEHACSVRERFFARAGQIVAVPVHDDSIEVDAGLRDRDRDYLAIEVTGIDGGQAAGVGRDCGVGELVVSRFQRQ